MTAVCNWLIRALGAILCIRVMHMGLPETVICMCIDQVFRAASMFVRFRSGSWVHVIRDQKKS